MRTETIYVEAWLSYKAYYKDPERRTLHHPTSFAESWGRESKEYWIDGQMHSTEQAWTNVYCRRWFIQRKNLLWYEN